MPNYLEAFDLNQSGINFWHAANRWLDVLYDMSDDLCYIYFDALNEGKTEEEASLLIDTAVANYQPTR